MKSGTRILLAVFIVLLSLSAGMVGAQESDPALPTLVMIQSASSGMIVDNGSGALTLTLNGVTETLLVGTDPVFFGRYGTELIVSGWASGVGDEAYPVNAVLTVADLVVELTVMNPEYADGSVSFEAEVVGIASVDADVNPDKIELPEAFEAADLTIQLTAELSEMIGQGLTSGIRVAVCQSQYDTWRSTKIYSDYRAYWDCLRAGG